ncbi:MAG: NAD(P)H-dependent oxidoreductase, partial [Candidatus Stygibacter australis]|nr:NAD(P)H-dependent oxidoreductase [Candidatus Stygibacter australis]
MRILAIIGSPRAGNTLKTAQLLEKELQKSDDSLEFEYINLWKADIKLCLGCFNCMAKGIENCPLKDDIPSIIQKMTKADGIILASPVYVMNVTSNMKNFIDRLAAFCHRPAFFQQKALVLSTVGGVGVEKVLSYLKEVAEAIGMQDVTKLGLVTPPAS